MEQRYQVVLEVISSELPVTEVAERYGVSPQTVYAWLARYEAERVSGLADRSHRPRAHPWQLDPEVAALICRLNRDDPRWGPRRLRYELGVKDVARCGRGRRGTGCWCVSTWSPVGLAAGRTGRSRLATAGVDGGWSTPSWPGTTPSEPKDAATSDPRSSPSPDSP